MEHPQQNSQESRAALAKAAAAAQGSPLLSALDRHLARELESLAKSLVSATDVTEIHRVQGRYTALEALRKLLNQRTTA